MWPCARGGENGRDKWDSEGTLMTDSTTTFRKSGNNVECWYSESGNSSMEHSRGGSKGVNESKITVREEVETGVFVVPAPEDGGRVGEMGEGKEKKSGVVVEVKEL